MEHHMNHSHDHAKKWQEIVIRTWTDPTFKAQLLSHPKRVLEEYGIVCHEQIKVVENSKDLRYLTLPEKPHGHLSNAELKKIAAAGADYDPFGPIGNVKLPE